MNEQDTHLELIRRYLDGAATAEEAQTLEALILRDPAMRREFLRYAHLDAALAGNLRPTMIEGILRSARQTAQVSVKPRSRWLSWRPLAAAALVLLLMGAMLTLRRPSKARPDVAAAIESAQNAIARMSAPPLRPDFAAMLASTRTAVASLSADASSPLPAWMSPTASLLEPPYRPSIKIEQL